ncbi:CAP domain-containing protein [Lyngbya sp. CCY1209]|jgi:uncharacterized protein YkwD|uniref:CAP domain-containing protein n=1 Tax=Lyngbya sp. CCY1209 TaxID=2886103 RepID=UPI002D2126BE|nr:CAP domain-containing protein [Lyngbya sp. CCY1209]MEB3882700.1 CAP domain-containing protein [Lyngbya sp. CCY1209]
MKQKLIAIALLSLGAIAGCDVTGEVNFMANSDNSPIPTMAATAAPDISALEQTVHAQVNEYRQSQGLPPLKLDSRISQEARRHSQNMASGQVPFSHEGSKQRYQAIGQQISYRQIAENVAYNSGYANPGKQAVEGWIDSPGHEENMTGDYDLTGIGIARNDKGEYYFTQIFVRPR